MGKEPVLAGSGQGGVGWVKCRYAFGFFSSAAPLDDLFERPLFLILKGANAPDYCAASLSTSF